MRLVKSDWVVRVFAEPSSLGALLCMFCFRDQLRAATFVCSLWKRQMKS